MTRVLVPHGFGVRPARGATGFERLFDELWKGVGAPRVQPDEAPAWRPRADLRETEAELVVSLELPGLDEKDIEVDLEDEVLTIRGERRGPESPGDGTWHRIETFRGRFERALRLPTAVETDAVRAVYRNGVLTVTLPKATEARVRHVPITGPGETG